MKSIKVEIIDDEKPIRDLYSTYVTSWSLGKFHTKIKTFESAEEFLFKYEENQDLDILLLDIEMKRIN